MKLTGEQLAWLAGVMDGEGTIALYKEKSSRTSHFYARCIVHVIANTNPVLIIRVAELLGEAGIKYSIGTLIGEQKRQKNWSRAWNMKISGLDAMKEFLPMIEPYLVGKKEQAQLAMRFLERRSSGHAAWGITELDEALMARCQQLNTTGSSESVETIRGISKVIAFGKDMARTSRRREEAGRNDQPQAKVLA
jgi:hypothetical protein